MIAVYIIPLPLFNMIEHCLMLIV